MNGSASPINAMFIGSLAHTLAGIQRHSGGLRGTKGGEKTAGMPGGGRSVEATCSPASVCKRKHHRHGGAGGGDARRRERRERAVERRHARAFTHAHAARGGGGPPSPKCPVNV